jgi:hypothetical protein
MNPSIPSQVHGTHSASVGAPYSAGTVSEGGGAAIFLRLKGLLTSTRLNLTEQQNDFLLMSGRLANAAGESEKNAWQETARTNRTLATQALIGAVIAGASAGLTLTLITAQGISSVRTANRTGVLQQMENHIKAPQLGAAANRPSPVGVQGFLDASKQSFNPFRVQANEVAGLRANLNMARARIELPAQRLSHLLNLLLERVVPSLQGVSGSLNAISASVAKADQLKLKSEDQAATTQIEITQDLYDAMRSTLDDSRDQLTNVGRGVRSGFETWISAMNPV